MHPRPPPPVTSPFTVNTYYRIIMFSRDVIRTTFSPNLFYLKAWIPVPLTEVSQASASWVVVELSLFLLLLTNYTKSRRRWLRRMFQELHVDQGEKKTRHILLINYSTLMSAIILTATTRHGMTRQTWTDLFFPRHFFPSISVPSLM